MPRRELTPRTPNRCKFEPVSFSWGYFRINARSCQRNLLNPRQFRGCADADVVTLPVLQLVVVALARAVGETGSKDAVLTPTGPPVGPPNQNQTVFLGIQGGCCGPAGGTLDYIHLGYAALFPRLAKNSIQVRRAVFATGR